MRRTHLVEPLPANGLLRRRLLKGLCATAGFVAARPRLSLAKDMTAFTWSGYEVPETHQSYIDKYGASPQFGFFGSTDEALQKLRGGYKPDTVHPCLNTIALFKDADVIVPIDVNRLQYWNDLWPTLTTMPGVEQDGKIYMVPGDWGTGSILYRTDLVDVKEESWNLLFDEKYAGRIATTGNIDNVVVAALAAGVDPFAMSDTEWEKVAKLLRKQRDLVRFYWDSTTELTQALASGEIVAAYAWNDAYVTLKNQGVPVGYMNPKEGKFVWVCGLSLANTGVDPLPEAYDFIDAFLSPPTGKYVIEAFGFGHSNKKSFDLVPAERLEELGLVTSEQVLSSGVFNRPMERDLHDKAIRTYEQIKAGG